MDFLFNLVAFLALIAFLVGLVMVIMKKTRRKGKWTLIASFIVLAVATSQISKINDQKAIEAGFVSADDQKEANKAGFLDAKVWANYKAELSLKAAEKAKQEAAIAEEKAKQEAAELVAKEEQEKKEAAIAEEKAKQEAAIAEEKAKKEAAEQAAKEEQEKKEAAIAEAEKQAACLNDAKCTYELISYSADADCKIAIERMAKYDFEWIDSWAEPAFSRVGWDNKDKRILNIVGDTLKLQNGFGAWQRQIYSCKYDVSNEIVVDVKIAAGRLPQ